jgi:hypothetical protein
MKPPTSLESAPRTLYEEIADHPLVIVPAAVSKSLTAETIIE